MAKVVGLGGVFFKARDPQALGKWYADHLGVPVQHPYGAVFAPAAVPAGGCQVWTPFAADTTYFRPARRAFMVSLMVDDLDGALAQVAAGGARVLPAREDSEYGRFGWFLDPEGNKVELWQPPAGDRGAAPA